MKTFFLFKYYTICKKHIRNIFFLYVFGKKKFQNIFFWLYEKSLIGMNYGGGRNFRNSGELNCIIYLKDKIFNYNNLVIFDVGANEGYYATEIDKIFSNHKYTIYSFEPSKDIFKLLKKNIKSNNIVCFNYGFSDKEEQKEIIIYDRSTEYTSLYNINYEYENIYPLKKEIVELLTIDKFCTVNKIDKIHFLKIDTEGHEFFILNGARDMINRDRIIAIQFEFGVCNIDSRTFFKDFYYFLCNKYNIYRIVRDGLYKINQYSYKLEIFDVANFIALHKSIDINL